MKNVMFGSLHIRLNYKSTYFNANTLMIKPNNKNMHKLLKEDFILGFAAFLGRPPPHTTTAANQVLNNAQ